MLYGAEEEREGYVGMDWREESVVVGEGPTEAERVEEVVEVDGVEL